MKKHQSAAQGKQLVSSEVVQTTYLRPLVGEDRGKLNKIQPGMSNFNVPFGVSILYQFN